MILSGRPTVSINNANRVFFALLIALFTFLNTAAQESGGGGNNNPNQPEEEKPDFRRDGIFKVLFNAGINASQIDGDGYAGYNLLGFQGGVGTMIRFHKNMSVSMEINYSMEGAKQKFQFVASDSSLQQYRTNLNYIQMPVSFNVHAGKLIMVSGGLAVGVLVGYRQQNEDGQDVTSNPPEGEQPNKIDFSAFGGLYFIIHKNFALGGKFSYSLIKFRGPQYPGVSRLNGEFNNVISLRFMYILDTVKKKK